MSRLRTLFRLSMADRMLLLEACIFVLAARIRLRVLSFPKIARALGNSMHESPVDIDSRTSESVERVAWALRTVERNLPRGCTCLELALAGKAILKRRRLASTLYLGLDKDAQHQLKAHAWLRVGNVIITGGNEVNLYAVVATFAEADS